VTGAALSAFPADSEGVRAAFRLGWAVSELRGRARPDLFLHPEPDEPAAFKRILDDHPLPLGSERKNREVRIETLTAAAGLSAALHLDVLIGNAPALGRMRSVTEGLENTNDAQRRQLWPGVARAFYSWDAQLQDKLVVDATPAAAYQLGRALAETYWALVPARSDQEMGSWLFVLGPRRVETVERLLARLSAYLGPLVQAAISSSFEAWSLLASDQERREADGVLRKLYEQGLLWRDLARGERDPLHLAPPASGDPWKRVSAYAKAARALKAPLITGALFAAMLVAGAALLASGAKYPWLTTALSIVGALGVTSAGLYAKAKARLTSLLNELRLKLDEERVRSAANLCPTANAPDG
jgi:hypothetical protein